MSLSRIVFKFLFKLISSNFFTEVMILSFGFAFFICDIRFFPFSLKPKTLIYGVVFLEIAISFFVIPSKQYNHFITQKKFSKTAVMSFANEIGIDPGIVVGRLQKEKLITYKMLNELKTKYELN